jgi:hypothetical protein
LEIIGIILVVISLQGKLAENKEAPEKPGPQINVSSH